MEDGILTQMSVAISRHCALIARTSRASGQQNGLSACADGLFDFKETYKTRKEQAERLTFAEGCGTIPSVSGDWRE